MARVAKKYKAKIWWITYTGKRHLAPLLPIRKVI